MQGARQKIRRRVLLRGGGYHDEFWYMPQLEIGLADVSKLNFDQFFMQFNAKKKINAKRSS